jgi:superfamily I DNA/RNA helicase/RecB family exonuclease
MAFEPDPGELRVLEHQSGPLLVTGDPGTGKSALLLERFARLIESGADPERVGLVVRSPEARRYGRGAALDRLARPLTDLRVLTVHGLALHVMSKRHRALDYERVPELLTAFDQLSKVRDLLNGESPAEWPTCGNMLRLRGFAEEVRQLLNRAQEGLIAPEDMKARAESAGLPGWSELARFFRVYLDVLAGEGLVDFAGLVAQAAAASGAPGEPPFDHLLVDDFQEATLAEESLLMRMAPASLVVAGDPGSHVFSFQGTTDVPIRRLTRQLPQAEHVDLKVQYRGGDAVAEAWAAAHPSEEYAAVARELRRIHVEDGIPWGDLAVVVRRHGSHVGGLVRAMDDADVPRSASQAGLSLLADPAVLPFVLALRWLAHPGDRDGLIEPILTSELVGLSPASARGLIRAAQGAGAPPSEALALSDGLTQDEALAVHALRDLLDSAESIAERSAQDAFAILWRGSAYSARLVGAEGGSEEARRDLDAVLAFSQIVERAGERADASVRSFLELLEGGEDEPDLATSPAAVARDAVHILTAHGIAGREFHTVVAVGSAEGNFPSLARPEPMFDLGGLDGALSQSERNRRRLEDERRLFRVVATRARRRTLFTASDPHDQEGGVAARSRFVGERGIGWTAAPTGPFPRPLSLPEAAAVWRREMSDASGQAPGRLAALGGLLRIGDRPSSWWFQRDWTGDDRPLHDEVRVSFSRLEKLDNCALQYVLSEELGLEGEAGYYAWVGHLVHGIIEDCEEGKIERTGGSLAQAANDRWSSQEFPSRAVSEAFRRTVVERMLPNWLAAYGKSEALAGEVPFEFEFEGATVSGRIDRVGRVDSGGSQITDYKTGRAKGGPVEDNLQLGIYYLAVARSEDLAQFRPVKAVELAFLKEERGGRRFHAQLAMNSTTQREFGKRMADRLGGLIRQVRQLMQTEVYRPSPTAECRYCHFRTLCPLWPEGRELFPAEVRP